MSARSISVTARSAAIRPSAVGQIAANLGRILRAWRNRRDFYRLGQLSDAELHDIGLTRADLHVAVAQPFTQDPTAYLRAVVDRRPGLGGR